MYTYYIFIRYTPMEAQRHAHNETFALVVSYDHYTLTHTSSQTDIYHERTDTGLPNTHKSHCKSLQLFMCIHTHTFSPRDRRRTPIAAPHNSLQLITLCKSLQFYTYTHILTKRHQTHPNSCTARFIATHCNSLQLIATLYLYMYTHTHPHKETHDTPK